MRTGPGVAGEWRDVDLGLSGRRAIVCASSQGIGLACARALAREGATVLINGRDPERLERAIEALSAEGLSARKLAADVTIEEGRRALLATCPEPDILVTNSGGPKLGDFRDWSVADWETSLNQYMIAPIQLIRGVVDGMIARRFGRIVNLSSRAVRAPPPFSGLSTGGRAGLGVFAAGLAREVARYNVTINNLLPGPFRSERQMASLASIAELRGIGLSAAVEERVAEVPAARLGELEEVGSYCAYLCSAQAGYIVGQSLLIDGGAVQTV